jgi:DNA-binding GntR family transcriptional regulator
MQEIVYDTIKERVLQGKYSSGVRLVAKDLADEFGVSRMPVREALQRLEAATGLITLIPHRGAVVNSRSEEDIIEVFHMRAVLEGLAARLACPNMSSGQVEKLARINAKFQEHGQQISGEKFQELNREFHSSIWAATHAPRLVATLKLLYEASSGYRYISINIPGRFKEVVREHRSIVAALRKRDAGEAERVVNEHYRKTLDWLMRSRGKTIAERATGGRKKRATGTRGAEL